MIKIIDDWYVTIDENPTNYTVRRGTGAKDKKNTWRDKPCGHYGSLRLAIKAIRGLVIANELSEGSRTLSEAIQTIEDIDKRFDTAMERVTA